MMFEDIILNKIFNYYKPNMNHLIFIIFLGVAYAAYGGPYPHNSITYKSQISYYGQITNITHSGNRPDSLEIKSTVIFNCSIYEGDVIIQVFVNVINCKIDSFPGSLCSHHSYIAAISSGEPHDRDYFIVEYYWGNSACGLLIFTAVMITLLILTACIPCFSLILFSCVKSKNHNKIYEMQPLINNL